ncbi:MAG: PEP/pyruvate-binding domain-containing protein [Candidatus Eisenbacteria bacterium]|uniref:Histidine kinase n=1 Tax=Eiseniibacteriota bacterium TaxID=2212470 RepID=A0A956LX50_UNCEI|nr:histidine kinase [Candidatus Eisenbacteria bacterium]
MAQEVAPHEIPAGRSASTIRELMPFRVREVLLVASEYDSYTLSEDGQLAESLDVEFYQLKLSWAPRLTTVSSAEDALAILRSRPLDLVITKSRIGTMDTVEFCRTARSIQEHLRIVFLADNPLEALRVKEMEPQAGLDQTFVWRGDVRLFLAIVKYIEDRENVQSDSALAGVRTIILIENSVRFYSSYLPLLYTELVKQTSALMADGVNTAQRLRRMKTRAKILLAESFEEGWEIFEKYHQSTLGVITDARFPRGGVNDPEAGLEFVRRVREVDPDMPALVQSTDRSLESAARELGADFLDKHSAHLLDHVRDFLRENLGFGDFVFRLPSGVEVARVSDLAAMPTALRKVPLESVIYHGTRNQFSNWLMARTEFGLASLLRPQRVYEFDSPEDLREHLIRAFERALSDARRGMVVDFSRSTIGSGSGVSRIGSGSMGGKGRGLGFAHALITREADRFQFPDVRVVVPPSWVVGSDVFDEFLDRNHLREIALGEASDEQIARAFLEAELPPSIFEDLRLLANAIPSPLAVRSSSLLEDSHNRPFAGIYHTYMLPNVSSSAPERLERLTAAIKLVFASTFFHAARTYLRDSPYRMEEEKMPVVIQQLMGRRHEDVFYPDVSGVARSYNFYPVLDMEADEGVAAVALGLGRTVVQGERAIRFSPARPQLLPQFSSTEATLENAQREFYALDLRSEEDALHPQIEEEWNLVKLGLDAAERHGTLRHVGSVYSPENDSVSDGLSRPGIRLTTFAPVLKSGRFSLPEILHRLLPLLVRAMSSEVEIEFAMNFEPGPDAPAEFGLLQVRPVSLDQELGGLDLPTVSRGDLLCASDNALGNGRITGICDVIYVKPDGFNRSQTPLIATQVGSLNDRLQAEDRYCLLIGPGRWGTADRWLGIPVEWGQISRARAIVETDLTEVPVTPSEGTHFFQNLISFGIGYFHVHRKNQATHVDYDWLDRMEARSETPYVRHVRLEQPLQVLVDARTRHGIIIKA